MTTPDRDPYRRIARLYDLLLEPLNAGVRDVALRIDPPRPEWKVLDVGCGTGTGLQRYADAGCDAHGVDVSPAMLAQARARLGDRAQLQLIAGTELPFPDGTFDVVTATMVLHEVAAGAREALVADMARVARDDGHLLIVDFRFGSLRGLKGPLIKALTRLVERISGHWDGFRSFRRGGGVPGLASRAGIEIQSEKITAGGNLAVYVANDAP